MNVTDYEFFYEELFRGYVVPKKLKETAIAIMRRFTITGICDGMYICNEIAYENGIGDGMSHFTGDEIVNFDVTAKRLQHCYGSNIFKEDIEELQEILRTGELDREKSITGIKGFISKCRKEKQNCEEWRRDYLNRCIQNAKFTLMQISA